MQCLFGDFPQSQWTTQGQHYNHKQFSQCTLAALYFSDKLDFQRGHWFTIITEILKVACISITCFLSGITMF